MLYNLAIFGTPSGGEILLVMVVVLLLFGAKNLPKMARTLGKTLEEFRRAAREVSDEIVHADDPPAPNPPKRLATPKSDAPKEDGLESDYDAEGDEEMYDDDESGETITTSTDPAAHPEEDEADNVNSAPSEADNMESAHADPKKKQPATDRDDEGGQ